MIVFLQNLDNHETRFYSMGLAYEYLQDLLKYGYEADTIPTGGLWVRPPEGQPNFWFFSRDPRRDPLAPSMN